MLRTKTSPDRPGGRSPRWGRGAGVGLLVLTPTVAAIWLFLAAVPALADGGPHIKTINDGSLGINADSCAGCHRAHTAKGPMLINAADEEALCLTCHGSGGVGSTVDVMTGVQYKVALAPGSAAQDPSDPTVLLGALRKGGFDKARIDAGLAARRRYGTGMDDFYAKVPVGAPEDVTSSHLAMADNGLTMPGIAWGNGGNGTGSGPQATVTCASCHNPHGNGQYRILNPIPEPDVTGGTFTAVTGQGVPVLDSAWDNPDPAESDVKNYTVIQRRSPFLLYADDVLDAGFGPATGDYLHRFVPWNQAPSGSTGTDAPNGLPSSFSLQINNWCLACHTRYNSSGADSEQVDPITGDPDTVFRYQHQTTTSGQTVCTTCHVSHGSNAAMTGPYTGAFPYPDDPATAPAAVTSGSSRLLKVDNRGTCQLCHDPTNTTVVGSYTGPNPSPGVP